MWRGVYNKKKINMELFIVIFLLTCGKNLYKGNIILQIIIKIKNLTVERSERKRNSVALYIQFYQKKEKF